MGTPSWERAASGVAGSALAVGPAESSDALDDGAAAVSEASVPVEPDGDAEPASEGAEAEGAGADEEEVSEAAPWASPSCGAAQPASTRARATEVPHTRRARNGAG